MFGKSNKHGRAVFICGAVMVLLFSSHVHAGRVLKVATGEWPPYVSSALSDFGCIASMVTQALALQGYTVEYTFLPWSRGYARAKQGHYDANVYWYRNKQREKDFWLSKNNLSLERLGIYYLKGHVATGESYAEFKGKKIVFNPGFTYPDELLGKINQYDIEVLEARTEPPNLEWMIKGRADATVFSEKVAGSYLAALSIQDREKVLKSNKLQGFLTGHVLFSRAVQDGELIREAFDRGFEKLMSDEEYKYNYQHNCSQF